jgi:hypothetical protein
VKVVRASQCLVWGSLAALLGGGVANPERTPDAALNGPEAAGALAYAPGSGFSLANYDQKPAVAAPDVRAVSPEPQNSSGAATAEPQVSSEAAAFVPAVSSEQPTKPGDVGPDLKLAAIEPDVKVTSIRTVDECILEERCIDLYLWSVYERTPKFDTVKTSEQTSETVKKKGKTRKVTKTITKLVSEDFTWKDPDAAQKAGMSTPKYVIGGMDRGFKLKLYRLLRALDEAELEPGITSAFRDDYRQSIAAGKKAASDNSYHGGSRHGGYGHGLAADLVSVRGETRADRMISSEELWKWIDAHGREFGIGRPYLDKDPPHVGPIDGKEYADHRIANPEHRAEKTKRADLTTHRR